MPYAQGISLTGNPYANDSAFWNAYTSFNPNFMSQYQQYAQLAAAQAAQAPQAASQAAAATDSTALADPTFKGSADSGDSGVSTGLMVGGGIVTGAAALIYAAKKGNGQGIKAGVKNIWNSIKGKVSTSATESGNVTSKITNFIKNGGKNLKEYTVHKEGMSFVMKDGKPIKIITQDKKVIDKAADVAKWVRDAANKSTVAEVRGLKLNEAALPKGVSLSYQKIITDGKNSYRMIVEDGKVVKAFSQDKSKKWVEVAEDQFEGFVKNHAKQVKEAETLTKTFGGKKIQLTNKKGNLVAQTGSIQMNVRNGEVVSAKFNGTRDLTKKELEALQKDYQKEIENFGRENGSRYGLGSNYEYVYRQKGGQEIRFDGSHKIKRVNAVKEKEITNSDAVKSWLEKNEEIATELENIATTGTAGSKGYRIGHMVYKTDSGITFEINGDKINGIKLKDKTTIKGKTFNSGELIDGKYLGEWRKTAENNNEYKAVLDMIK